MAWDATHWTIDRATGNIRYTGPDHGIGGETYVTVIDFRRALGALADDEASVFASGDEIDITDPTPVDRKTDNYIQLLGSYNIDDAASEHIYDGSIVQGTGGTEEFYDGIVNYGNPAVQIQIIQDGAVITDDWWNQSGVGLNANATAGISHRFMIKTRTLGADIDNRVLLGTARRFGYTYKEFLINGTARGNNVLALADAADLNNTTVVGTVATWDKFANDNEGYIGIDVNNDLADEYYYSSWNIGAGTLPVTPVINDLYEWIKYVSRDGSAETIYGLSGEVFRGITHEIDITGIGGTWVEPEEVMWGTDATAGVGQLLAVNNTTGTGTTKMWIQHLTGVVPNANVISGATGSGTAGTVLPRTVSLPFLGVSTGTAIIGGYGFGVDTSDLTKNDKVFDLTATQILPPNTVTVYVYGLETGEDRLLVTNNNAGNIDYAQFTLNGTLNGGTVTSVVVNGSIPTDCPTTGTIRIERDSGAYTLHPFSVRLGSTFTITSHSFVADPATTANNVFISYFDLEATAATESIQYVYLADRTYFLRGRDGGGTPIKTFETTFTVGTNGGSGTMIRTSDA